MDKNKETFTTWNNIATLYQDKFMHLDLYNTSYDYICKSIAQPNATILEIGCGPGNISKYLLSQRPDFDILGIDIAPNMIALARQNNPKAKFQVMDSRNIHNLNKKFDAIVVGFCLPYLSQTESQELIANAHQLLNDKGLLYLSFVAGASVQSGFKTGSAGRVYFYYHQEEDVKNCLKENGFEAIKTEKVNFKRTETEIEEHTILTAQKKG